MKKFEFKLEKVLGIRRFQQEQAQIELGKALAAEQVIQNKLDQIAVQHATVVKQTELSTDFAELNAAQQYYKLLDIQKEQLLAELAKAKIVSEQKRAVLQKAMQKCSAVSKLREKELEVYNQETVLEEEILTDDIVTAHFRNSK